MYPSLVSESDATSTGRRGQQNKDDDELWTPQDWLNNICTCMYINVATSAMLYIMCITRQCFMH